MVEGLLKVIKGIRDVELVFDNEESATDFARNFGNYLATNAGREFALTFPMSEPQHVIVKRGEGIFGYEDEDEVHLAIPINKYYTVDEFLKRQMRLGVA